MLELDQLPSHLLAQCLLFLTDPKDMSSLLTARTTCKSLREGCSALPLRACAKLATAWTATAFPAMHLINSKGCSERTTVLGLFTRRIRRGITRHGKKTGGGDAKNGSCRLGDALADESDMEDAEERNIDELDAVWNDAEQLVRSFLKPRPPATSSDVNPTSTSTDGETSSPFQRFLLYARCLRSLPEEVATISPREGALSQICLPIRRTRRSVPTNSASSKESGDGDAADTAQTELCGASANFFSHHVSQDARFDCREPNASTTLRCPCCLSTSVRLGNVPYLAIHNVGDNARGPLAFTAVDPAWDEEDDEERQRRWAVPGQSRKRNKGIRLDGTAMFPPLRGIVHYTAATYPADFNFDIGEDGENGPEHHVQKHLLLLYCASCHDFGILSPVAQCANRYDGRCRPDVDQSVYGKLGVPSDKTPIQTVLMRRPRCTSAHGPMLGCNNAVVCTACLVNSIWSHAFTSCKSCDVRFCFHCSENAGVPNCKCNMEESSESEQDLSESEDEYWNSEESGMMYGDEEEDHVGPFEYDGEDSYEESSDEDMDDSDDEDSDDDDEDNDDDIEDGDDDDEDSDGDDGASNNNDGVNIKDENKALEQCQSKVHK